MPTVLQKVKRFLGDISLVQWIFSLGAAVITAYLTLALPLWAFFILILLTMVLVLAIANLWAWFTGDTARSALSKEPLDITIETSQPLWMKRVNLVKGDEASPHWMIVLSDAVIWNRSQSKVSLMFELHCNLKDGRPCKIPERGNLDMVLKTAESPHRFLKGPVDLGGGANAEGDICFIYTEFPGTKEGPSLDTFHSQLVLIDKLSDRQATFDVDRLVRAKKIVGTKTTGPSEQSATTNSLDVVLRQVSGGGHTGIIRSTPKSWFWLIQHLTIVNQGDVDEIISFELRMPIGKGSTANFSPVVTVPDGIDVPPETRLFGVEHVPAREPLNGALLFELDRGRIPGLEDAETGESPSFPDIILAKIAIVSELSGIEVVFGFMDLQFHRAKPSD